MNQSLTVILPIHNAQDRITLQVQRLLDVLPDLTDRFEIMIVDDASTDSTDELATEIAIVYPQVRVIRHPQTLGIDVATETGMEHSRGDVILVHDRDCLLDDSTLVQMWNGQHRSDHLPGRHEPQPLREGLLKRLVAWGDQVRKSPLHPQRRGVPVRRRRSAASSTVVPLRRAEANEPAVAADSERTLSNVATSSYCTSEF